MFIYNCWYVAAIATELKAGQVFPRAFLSEPVVLYRKNDSTVAALEDRCCHRLAPLSLGSVVQDTIQCGYHGFRFNEAGRCVHIPGQEKIPSRATVRAYPTIERHGFIWIWMGDPELSSDESSIPAALAVLDQKGWDARASYVHVKSGYRLIVDNLQDGSHAEIVHAKTLRVDGPWRDDATVRQDCRTILQVRGRQRKHSAQLASDEYAGRASLRQRVLSAKRLGL